MSRSLQTRVREALQIAQNSTTGLIDYGSAQSLENYLRETWGRVLAHPNTYIMTELEFAVFNHFRARAEYQNETARKAVQRFWDSRRASDGVSKR